MKEYTDFIVRGKEIGHKGRANLGRYSNLRDAMRAGRRWLSDSFMAREAIILAEDGAGYCTKVARASEWSGWVLF